MVNDLLKLSLSEILSNMISNISPKKQRTCRKMDDIIFIKSCLSRVVHQHSSGRDYLQYLQDLNYQNIARSTFFDALHSHRRKDFIKQCSNNFYKNLNSKVTEEIDYLKDFSELKGFNVISGDGHFIQHASHTKKNEKNKVYAPGSIYLQNLRNGLIQHLSIISDGTKKYHELPILKKALNFTSSKKDKTIYVLDKAYISSVFWMKMFFKKQYIITRLKENHDLTVIGNNYFDPNDPVNTAVQKDCIVEFASGGMIVRVIVYNDPETGKQYKFFTTLNNQKIRPGTICYLYFLRWQIEKSFDCFKNSFHEKKAWATGTNALEIQNSCIAMFYNLLLFLQLILKKENIEDNKTKNKFMANLKIREKIAEKKERSIHPLMRKVIRLSRITSQFIRLIRNHFFSNIDLKDLLPLFFRRMTCYL